MINDLYRQTPVHATEPAIKQDDINLPDTRQSKLAIRTAKSHGPVGISNHYVDEAIKEGVAALKAVEKICKKNSQDHAKSKDYAGIKKSLKKLLNVYHDDKGKPVFEGKIKITRESDLGKALLDLDKKITNFKNKNSPLNRIRIDSIKAKPVDVKLLRSLFEEAFNERGKNTGKGKMAKRKIPPADLQRSAERYSGLAEKLADQLHVRAEKDDIGHSLS